MTNAKDDQDKHKGSDLARKKLFEMSGRPFDIDKILAQDRARQEREQKARKEAEEKLEAQLKIIRRRRHELRAQNDETTAMLHDERKLKELGESMTTLEEERLRLERGMRDRLARERRKEEGK